MITASGAMTVGFGAKQSIDESRLLPMLFVTLGMAFATFLGVVIGHTNFFLVAMAALRKFRFRGAPFFYLLQFSHCLRRNQGTA